MRLPAWTASIFALPLSVRFPSRGHVGSPLSDSQFSKIIADRRGADLTDRVAIPPADAHAIPPCRYCEQVLLTFLNSPCLSNLSLLVIILVAVRIDNSMSRGSEISRCIRSSDREMFVQEIVLSRAFLTC